MKKLILKKEKVQILLLLFLITITLNCFSQVNCFSNGVNITITGSANSPYSVPTSTTACLPNSAFAGNGIWTGFAATGVVTYTFSQPVINATVSYSAVNFTGTDVGQIVIDGGGTLTITNPCGVAITGGNVLTCNLGGVAANIYGDVSVTVNSTLPFTTVTLTNIGGSTGWVQGNPCNFVVCLPTETLSSPTNNMDNNFANGLTLIERSNWISASNLINVGNNNLQDGVVYHAANFVDLTPGFDAVSGSQFVAYPQGCTDPQSFVYKYENLRGNIVSTHPSVAIRYEVNFELHPNPASNFVDLSMKNGRFNRISIAAIDGKIVFEKNIERSTTYQVDVSPYANGIYIINVTSEDGQLLSKKLIKN